MAEAGAYAAADRKMVEVESVWCMKASSEVESRGCHYKRMVGAGEPVVFIQLVGLHGDGWLPQTQVVGSEFECVTFDNRGMGKSQPAGAAITVQQMAEDALSVMDAAGIRAAHLVGHSLGGAVALQTALSAQSEEPLAALHFGPRRRVGWSPTRHDHSVR